MYWPRYFPSQILPKQSQVICDLRNLENANAQLCNRSFDVMIHLAAEIDFAVKDQNCLYSNNLISTKNAAELAKNLGVKSSSLPLLTPYFWAISPHILMQMKRQFQLIPTDNLNTMVKSY